MSRLTAGRTPRKSDRTVELLSRPAAWWAARSVVPSKATASDAGDPDALQLIAGWAEFTDDEVEHLAQLAAGTIADPRIDAGRAGRLLASHRRAVLRTAAWAAAGVDE